MRAPTPISVSPDEEELLKRGKTCEEFIQQPMWLEIEKFANLVVEEALEQMRGNQSSDPVVAKHYQNVWRERESFRDRLILFVKGPIRAKKELLIQIEEEKQYGRSAY